MTRKHYIALAEALRTERPFEDGEDYFRHSEWRKGASDEWHTIVLRIASVLAADNPRFDKQRFGRACGTRPGTFGQDC